MRMSSSVTPLLQQYFTAFYCCTEYGSFQSIRRKKIIQKKQTKLNNKIQSTINNRHSKKFFETKTIKMAHSLINISAVKQQVTVAKCKPVFKVISNDGSVSEEMDLEGIKKWHSSNKQENSSSSESASSIKNTDGSTNRINQINWKDLFNLENLVG